MAQNDATQNRKSAQQMHSRTYSRSDSRYWFQKVRKAKSAAGVESPNYSIQIAFRGRRMRFSTGTSNRDAAAKRAQEIYLVISQKGWADALKLFKASEDSAAPAVATVGQWIDSVCTTAGFQPNTVTIYAQALRLIVSEIAGVGDQQKLDEHGVPVNKNGEPVILSRFDYRSGGKEAWQAAVGKCSLSILTPDAIQKWRLSRLKKAGAAPDTVRAASNSISANLRNARALFTPKARAFVPQNLLLPEPRPFEGVKLEKKQSTRYQSRIDARSLIASARQELGREVFKIFCLAMFCGLRKKEIDALLWTQVNLEKGCLLVESNQYFATKSEDSIGSIDLEAELVVLMKEWKAEATGEFVIQSSRSPRYQTSRTNYRAEREFAALYSWLRERGVTARKPLHELRKEVGAILASSHGVFEAQQVLRHADIRTTSAYYADKKARMVPGLGSALG